MSDTLNITLYTPHPKQLETHQSPARFKILNWGRRTGKSLFAMNHTLIEATKRVGRYWIVAPTYRQAKNIYWLDVLPNTIPKELIAKKNESELIIHLINGSLIELKGADNPDSLRGAGIKGLILDEYAFMSPSVWETILRPTLVDSGGWAIFISTPNGFNHFYDLAEYAQGHDSYFYSHATSYDNPHIPDSEIDDLRDDYIAKGKENEFHQEYMGEFRKMSGLVYKTFDRKIHVVDPKDVPETGTHLLSVDFGYTNPMAAVFVLVDRDDNWWVYDELYDTGLVTEQAVNIIQTKMGNNRFSTMVGDSAAAQEIANFNNAGLPIKPCEKTKDSIMSGIRTISDRLKVQEGTGKPKLFISSVCTNLIFEFEAYHYPEEKEGRNASEMPLKENDHACFIASTTVLTKDGPVFINKIKAGDKVLTPFGEEEVIAAQSMGVKKVKGYDRFVSTPDHPILTSKGIAPVDSLRYDSKVWLQLNQKQFTLTEYLIAGILTRKKEVRDFIFGALLTRSLEARLATSTETSGNIIEESFLKDMLSTTLKDTTTIALNLSNSLQVKNTLNIITGENTKVTKRFSKVLDHLQKHGIVPALAESGTQNMGDVLGWEDRAWLQSVMCAVEDTILTSLVEADSVLEPVKLRTSDELEVFNLATPSGMFFANGVLVSNCDALRYLAISVQNTNRATIYKPSFYKKSAKSRVIRPRR